MQRISRLLIPLLIVIAFVSCSDAGTGNGGSPTTVSSDPANLDKRISRFSPISDDQLEKEFIYNDAGQNTRIQWRESDELKLFSEQHYDSDGRVSVVDFYQHSADPDWQDNPVTSIQYTYNADGLPEKVTKNAWNEEYTFAYNEDGTLATMIQSDSSGIPDERTVYTYNAQLFLTEVRSFDNVGSTLTTDPDWVGSYREVLVYEGGTLASIHYYSWDSDASEWVHDEVTDVVMDSSGWIISVVGEYQDPDAPAGQPNTYDWSISFDSDGYPSAMTNVDSYWSSDNETFVQEREAALFEWEEGPMTTDIRQLDPEEQAYLTVPGLWFFILTGM
jgi:hypothetical protein